MRDGIPKSIPVPRKWQKLVECADRAADRGTQRVLDRLLDAIRHTLSRYFPAEQRKLLAECVANPQLLLPGVPLPNILTQEASIADRSFHLGEVFKEAQKATEQGLPLADAVRNTIAAKIESDVVAHYRQIFEDLAGKCRPNELDHVWTELNRVATQVVPLSEADRFLKIAPDAPPLSTQKIRPDEDIR